MANKFTFEVTATDRFTKVFRGLNNEASKALRPINNQLRAIKMLGREIHLPALGRGLAGAARGAQTLASSLGSVAAPLTSLAGLGAGIGVVGLVAGLTDITAKWAQQGAEITRTSRSLGVATDFLQRYRGAAQLANLTTEDATDTIERLGAAVHDAQFGRNPQVLMMLDYLGVKVRKTKDGLIDLPPMIEDISRALAKYKDPATQRVIASTLGVERTLPMLREGPGALRGRMAEAASLGGVRPGADLAAAGGFQRDLNRLGIAAGGQAGRAGAKASGALAGPVRAATSLMSPSVPGPAPTQEEADALRGRFQPFAGRRGERAQLDVNVRVQAPQGTSVTASSNTPAVRPRIARTNDTP